MGNDRTGGQLLVPQKATRATREQTVTTGARRPRPRPTVVLTDVAAAKVKALLEQEGRDDLRLRVAVQPGGCSGLRYQLFFDERSLDGDVSHRLRRRRGRGRPDERALPAGRDDRLRRPDRAQGFTIDNPNAHGSCACGDSFH